ncbi:helix-turn-helix domain-containing protein [Nocardioides conyzicola]|uniref:HTH cro/C1-type domain-containing protein n=1 Tax=Nocardioides conyzicola TaxID=1651781 RepID=A0ABP8WQH4_9ACTN
MRDDLIDLARSIDPTVLGERVRTARLRAGLTQAQVAGSQMSVGYISRIESGQRRPDPQLLTAIADALGASVDELLVGVAPDRVVQLRVQLDHAQLALVTGSVPQALEIVDRILAEPATEDLPDVEREASYLRASALEASGDLQSAILLLEDLTEQQSADLAWINGATALSRCYRESGELGRAIEVGERAGAFIDESGLAGLDESVRLSLAVANAYLDRGDISYAARMCQRVVDRAEELASPVAKASAYWNLSIAESRRGRSTMAVDLARRALGILGAADDSRNVARLQTQVAILQLRLDPPEAAEALELLLRAERAMAITGGVPADLADNHLAQARAQFLLGDVDAARRLAATTADSSRTAAPVVAADALVLLGQIDAHAGDVQAARDHYQQAVLLLSAVGADRSAAQLWFELAHLLEGIGEASSAIDAYRRAGAASGLVASTTSSAPVTA